MIGKWCIVLVGLAAIILVEANPGSLSYGGRRRPSVHGTGVLGGIQGGRGVVGSVGAGHIGAGVGGVGAGVGSGFGASHGPGVGSGFGAGHGAGVGSGFGAGHGAGVGSGFGTGHGAGVGSGFGAGLGAGVGSGLGVGHVGTGAGVGVCAGQSTYDTSLFSDIVIGHPLLDRHPGQGNCNCKYWCLNSRLNKYYCCSRSTYAG